MQRCIHIFFFSFCKWWNGQRNIYFTLNKMYALNLEFQKRNGNSANVFSSAQIYRFVYSANELHECTQYRWTIKSFQVNEQNEIQSEHKNQLQLKCCFLIFFYFYFFQYCFQFNFFLEKVWSMSEYLPGVIYKKKLVA